MIRRICAIALAAASLGACATTSTVATAPVQLTVADGVTVVDTSYNGMLTLYLGAYQRLSPADKATAKKDLAKLLTCPAGATSTASCTGYVAAADAAARVGDATDLQAQATLALGLIAQIKALIPAK